MIRFGFSLPKALAISCLLGSALFASTAAFAAEETGADAKKQVQLIIDPASTKLSLATCNLSVGPLALKEDAYAGSYQIKVSPFAFKNDQGSLLLAFNDAAVKKLASGKPVEFTGKAVSGRDQKVKLIKGKTTPDGNDRGAVAFTVSSEDGDLLFNSKYRFEAK